MASLSTHVLDTASGRPAAGVHVTLERDGVTIARATTDSDGRVRELATSLGAGRYRIVFELDARFFRRVALDVEIGADPATLSATSRREQAAGDDPATLRDLATLNEEYERRFGFRFVVWVNGRSKSALIPVLRSRLRYDRERELATGIAEFLAIAADRLRSR